jgi:hypothetical protein
MPAHSAKSLFDLNMQSTDDCLTLFDGIEKLGTKLEISWLLRAGVVFSVSALDAYFHDKVKYLAGKFDLENLPPALAKFRIPIEQLTTWEGAERKGNVIRNWLTEHFSTLPLQRKDDIAGALKLVGIENLWATIEPDSPKREALIEEMQRIIKRRNQIAHEGDRESSRKSGKKLRGIDRKTASDCATFVRQLVDRIEKAFPN